MRLPVALASILVLAGCLSTTPGRTPRTGRAGDPAATTAQAPDRVTPNDLARLLHTEANAARRREGRRRLRTSDDLSAVALAHSRDMAARGFFSHVNPDGLNPVVRARRAGIACERPDGPTYVRQGVNENLFQTWISRETTTVRQGGTTRTIEHPRAPDVIAHEVIDGWLHSPPHRLALLDPNALHHGFGVVIRPDGAIYVTEVIC